MKFFRLIICAFIVFIVAFSCFYGFKQINYADKKLTGEQNYKCILTLWHIDTFEGGVGSRAEFLHARANEFEKKTNGVFIMVQTHTVESAKKSYLDGAKPDLVSFGYGIVPQNPSKVDEKYYFEYADIDGDCYAYAWCRGGYVILANKTIPEDKTLINAVVSQGEYTSPLTATAIEGYTLKNYKTLVPTEAYYKFITGDADYLLGTQRDVNRVISRNADVSIKVLMQYNDLYQYISVTSGDLTKKYYACAYVEYLLTEGVQSKLNKIGMFSINYKVDYADQKLVDMQNAVFDYGFNVFNSVSEYEKLKALSTIAVSGNEDALKKIKNFVA